MNFVLKMMNCGGADQRLAVRVGGSVRKGPVRGSELLTGDGYAARAELQRVAHERAPAQVRRTCTIMIYQSRSMYVTLKMMMTPHSGLRDDGEGVLDR